jgi:hypothetical protein
VRDLSSRPPRHVSVRKLVVQFLEVWKVRFGQLGRARTAFLGPFHCRERRWCDFARDDA